MISRRSFLLGSAAAVASTAVPASLAANTTATAPIIPPKTSALKAYIVGSEDSFDWLHIRATSYDDAVRQWVEEHDIDCECGYEWRPGQFFTKEDCPRCTPTQMAERVADWDDMDRLAAPGDWIRAGFGAFCNRCGGECWSECDAYAVEREAVCENCMEIADWEIVDPKRADELRNDEVDLDE